MAKNAPPAFQHIQPDAIEDDAGSSFTVVLDNLLAQLTRWLVIVTLAVTLWKLSLEAYGQGEYRLIAFSGPGALAMSALAFGQFFAVFFALMALFERYLPVRLVYKIVYFCLAIVVATGLIYGLMVLFALRATGLDADFPF